MINHKDAASLADSLVRPCDSLSAEMYGGRFPFMVIALFVFMGISCAKQGFPPGGPSDETPPYLLSSIPDLLSVNVSRNELIVLQFSESMDTKSVEDNLFIVPIPTSSPVYEWKSKDKELTILFKKPLLEISTYVISIGTKACDLRNNQLKESIMLSFSTGNILENRKISGRIIPFNFFSKERESVSAVDVVAYRMDDASRVPDPRDNVPDYVTQSGSDGTYEMVGLSGGSYRLFAIGDNDRNGFYSEGYDLIGVAPHDVVITGNDSLAFAPDIAVSRHDTSSVQLVSISVPDSRRIEVYFDRGIIPGLVGMEIDGLDIIDWFILPGSPGMISVATDLQENGKKYSVREIKVNDRDGNSLQPLDIQPFFTGKSLADTTALEVVDWRPKILQTGDEHIELVFNRIINFPDKPDEALTIEPAIDITVGRKASNIIELIPGERWRENSNYTVTFDRAKIKGIAGNMLTGLGSQFSFRVVSSDTLGFIEGSIEDMTGVADAVYHFNFKNIDIDIGKEIIVNGSQQWSTGPVLPGRYICRAYRDDNKDGEFFSGSVHPYRVSEQVFACPDTIVVVSRWTNEDNRFIFR